MFNPECDPNQINITILITVFSSCVRWLCHFQVWFLTSCESHLYNNLHGGVRFNIWSYVWHSCVMIYLWKHLLMATLHLRWWIVAFLKNLHLFLYFINLRKKKRKENLPQMCTVAVSLLLFGRQKSGWVSHFYHCLQPLNGWFALF